MTGLRFLRIAGSASGFRGRGSDSRRRSRQSRCLEPRSGPQRRRPSSCSHNGCRRATDRPAAGRAACGRLFRHNPRGTRGAGAARGPSRGKRRRRRTHWRRTRNASCPRTPVVPEMDASAAFRHVAASIREPSAEIHSLWGVLHPARGARKASACKALDSTTEGLTTRHQALRAQRRPPTGGDARADDRARTSDALIPTARFHGQSASANAESVGGVRISLLGRQRSLSGECVKAASCGTS